MQLLLLAYQGNRFNFITPHESNVSEKDTIAIISQQQKKKNRRAVRLNSERKLDRNKGKMGKENKWDRRAKR